MNTLRRYPLPALASVLAIAAAVAAAQSAPPVTLTKPASAEKKPAADGFIQRWMLLEPIGVTGLTEAVVQATVKKEYFPNQFTVLPKDGEKVTVGDSELT